MTEREREKGSEREAGKEWERLRISIWDREPANSWVTRQVGSRRRFQLIKNAQRIDHELRSSFEQLNPSDSQNLESEKFSVKSPHDCSRSLSVIETGCESTRASCGFTEIASPRLKRFLGSSFQLFCQVEGPAHKPLNLNRTTVQDLFRLDLFWLKLPGKNF